MTNQELHDKLALAKEIAQAYSDLIMEYEGYELWRWSNTLIARAVAAALLERD